MPTCLRSHRRTGPSPPGPLDLAEDQAERLLSRTAADFHADLGAAREAVRQRSSFDLIHLASGIEVDLFVVGRGDFDRSEFERGLLHEP